jgi:two-component system OmpR family sensor kinase
VTVTADAPDHGLSISVRDRGPGIDTGDLPHLFDRFYRGAAARQRIAGTGMGLAIARGLLTAQGGRIWAENCSDGGARFWLVIPAQRRFASAVESTT